VTTLSKYRRFLESCKSVPIVLPEVCSGVVSQGAQPRVASARPCQDHVGNGGISRLQPTVNCTSPARRDSLCINERPDCDYPHPLIACHFLQRAELLTTLPPSSPKGIALLFQPSQEVFRAFSTSPQLSIDPPVSFKFASSITPKKPSSSSSSTTSHPSIATSPTQSSSPHHPTSYLSHHSTLQICLSQHRPSPPIHRSSPWITTRTPPCTSTFSFEIWCT
jgi:hypothetical protein